MMTVLAFDPLDLMLLSYVLQMSQREQQPSGRAVCMGVGRGGYTLRLAFFAV